MLTTDLKMMKKMKTNNQNHLLIQKYMNKHQD